ncbi:MAG: glycine betaine ABC transporter substrate-binding protein [Pontimonas sp.]
MKKSLRNVMALMGASALLAVAGCAAETADTSGSGSSGSGGDTSSESMETASGLAQYDLSGVEIAVGSKDFTEQLILGEMMVLAFEEAGATVDNKVNLGGTSVARSALESGEIDIYMEYNGTGWAVHLAQPNPSTDPEELTANVRELDLQENGIVWISRSPFNDTYGFVSSPELTETNGGAFTLEGMMEYVRDNPDTVVCMESEYPNRDDGLVLLETAYGIEMPVDQQSILDTGIIYTETAANNCDFGEVYTTDGRIPALGLTLVEDPGVHILYNVSGTIREEKYNEAPEAFDGIIEAILAPLDEDRMAALNGQRDVDGLTPAQVAEQYLVEEGLISG